MLPAAQLSRYLDALLAPELAHVRSIRILTRTPSLWPYRFLSDADTDALMELFDRATEAGRRLSIVAWLAHPREMKTRAAQAAFRRILSTGVTLEGVSPVLRHVNDSASVWEELL